MSARIDICFAPAEGAIVRMLGLIERRGFELSRVAMADEASLSVELAARDPARRLEVLAAQLGRLVEVRAVSFSPSPQESAP